MIDELREICNQCNDAHISNQLYLKLYQRKRKMPKFEANLFAKWFVELDDDKQSEIIKKPIEHAPKAWLRHA